MYKTENQLNADFRQEWSEARRDLDESAFQGALVRLNERIIRRRVVWVAVGMLLFCVLVASDAAAQLGGTTGNVPPPQNSETFNIAGFNVSVDKSTGEMALNAVGIIGNMVLIFFTIFGIGFLCIAFAYFRSLVRQSGEDYDAEGFDAGGWNVDGQHRGDICGACGQWTGNGKNLYAADGMVLCGGCYTEGQNA